MHPFSSRPVHQSRLSRLAISLAVLALASLGLAAGASAIKLPKQQKPGELTVLLQLRHPKGLAKFVRSVSDPQSPEYGDYLTVEQIIDRFGANQPDVSATMQWLREHGATGKLGATGTFITARVAAGVVASALPAAGATASSTGAVSDARRVPASLRGSVAAVETVPTEEGAFHTGAADAATKATGQEPGLDGSSILLNTGTPSGCAAGRQVHYPVPALEPFNGYTPNEYLDVYGHSKLHKEGFKGQGKDIAVVEIDGFRHSDIETFAKCFGLPTPNLRVRPVGIPKALPPGEETTLDLEVLTAVAPKLQHIYVYEGGSSEVGILLSVAAALGSKGHHPDAISISLGGCEAGLTGELVYHDVLEEIFAVAGGSGISVLVAAGDTGSSACRLESENGTTALPLLAASDPATSPYVTAVGGTNLELTPKNKIKRQVVWNDSPLSIGAGSGGASIITTPRPWWQKGILNGAGNGRLVPDVAGLADALPGYTIYCTAIECRNPFSPEGGWGTIGGTSAATPLYAGGVILADGYAGAHNSPALGFLNPLIYELGREAQVGKAGGGILSDVIQGNDDLGKMLPVDAGGGVPLGCCSARVGYDMASGWGSLDLPHLAQTATARFERAETRAQVEARQRAEAEERKAAAAKK